MSIAEMPTGSVTRVTPFTGEGGALAAVTLTYGPVVIRARLRKSGEKLFLSMPARKDANNRWWDHCHIFDHELHANLERQAVQMYHAATAAAV